jgi:hypothetical protein
MKKLILLIILLTVSTNVFSGYFTGNDIIGWLKDDRYTIQREAYVSGVIDGIEMTDTYKNYICIPIKTTGQQIAQLTYNNMQQHPEKWTKTGSYFVISALIEAYPCKK